jgi:hypothetical protein
MSKSKKSKFYREVYIDKSFEAIVRHVEHRKNKYDKQTKVVRKDLKSYLRIQKSKRIIEGDK